VFFDRLRAGELQEAVEDRRIVPDPDGGPSRESLIGSLSPPLITPG
jgi:hypothetical protein